jgi:hypothetical protein
MPQLEVSKGQISMQVMNEARTGTAVQMGRQQHAMLVLRGTMATRHVVAQLVFTNQVDTVSAIQRVGVEFGVVEQNTPKVVGKQDIRVEVRAPAVVLEIREPGIDSGTFVESAAVLLKQVGLHAHRTMLAGNSRRFVVLMRGDHNHRVEVGMIETEGDV